MVLQLKEKDTFATIRAIGQTLKNIRFQIT